MVWPKPDQPDGPVHGVAITSHTRYQLVPFAIILHIGQLNLHLGVLALCGLHYGEELISAKCTISVDVSHLEQLFGPFDHEVLFDG